MSIIFSFLFMIIVLKFIFSEPVSFWEEHKDMPSTFDPDPDIRYKR